MFKLFKKLMNNNFNFAIKSIIGNYREENQDKVDAFVTNENNYCLIAIDGMGGHFGGKMAAKLTHFNLKKELKKTKFLNLSKKEINNKIVKIILNVQEKLIQYGKYNPKYNDMGATLVLCLIIRQTEAYFFHAGDSRAYLWQKDDGLLQITLDHSNVNYPNDIMHNLFQNNFLLHAMGPNKFLTNDSFYNTCQSYKLNKNKPYVICLTTDGIHGFLNEFVLNEQLSRYNDDPEMIINKLINLALKANSTDNCSSCLLIYNPYKENLNSLLNKNSKKISKA